jgi:hypothetical protein
MGTAKVGAFVDDLKPPTPVVVERSNRDVSRLSREVTVLGRTVRDALEAMTQAVGVMVKRSEDKPQVINFAPTISPTPVTVRNEVAAPEVRPPDVHFHAPETPAPVIRVEAIAPAQAPSQVTVINQVQPAAVMPTPLNIVNEVTLPEQPAPIFNLPAQDVNLTLNVRPKAELVETEVTERDSAGRLRRAVQRRLGDLDVEVESGDGEGN